MTGTFPAMVPLDAGVSVPDHVLFREIEGEVVLLSLDLEEYFNLDDVGTRFFQLLITEPNVRAALDALLAEFDVGEDELRNDLETFVGELTDLGLLAIDVPDAH